MTDDPPSQYRIQLEEIENENEIERNRWQSLSHWSPGDTIFTLDDARAQTEYRKSQQKEPSLDNSRLGSFLKKSRVGDSMQIYLLPSEINNWNQELNSGNRFKDPFGYVKFYK